MKPLCKTCNAVQLENCNCIEYTGTPPPPKGTIEQELKESYRRNVELFADLNEAKREIAELKRILDKQWGN